MATKAEIEAKIQSALTLNPGVLDWAEHENTLITDSDSILENVYGSVIYEDETAQSIFNIVTANIRYDLKLSKVGRIAHISGIIKNNTGSAISRLLDIVDDNWKPTENDLYRGCGRMQDGSFGSVSLRSIIPVLNQNSIEFDGIIFSGETISFSLTYNTQL